MMIKKYLPGFFALILASFVITSCLNDDNLIPENCFDGELNNGEFDVDCGGPNCDPCPPSCTNGLWDVDFGEIDIDCGGPNCDPCPTCNDGILNQDETGIDCGGENCDPCTSGGSCINGILDGDETDVDCGGPECPPCPEETCDDGIMNQDETGIDCGGLTCPICPDPTCGDGVLNQDETGIDCGGLFCDPCQTASQGQIIFRVDNGDWVTMSGTAEWDDGTMILEINGSAGGETILFVIPEGAGLSDGQNISFNAGTSAGGYAVGYSHPTLGNYLSATTSANIDFTFDTVDTAGGSSVTGTFTGTLQNFTESNTLTFSEGSFNVIVQ